MSYIMICLPHFQTTISFNIGGAFQLIVFANLLLLLTFLTTVRKKIFNFNSEFYFAQ